MATIEDTAVEAERVLTQVSERLTTKFPDVPAQRVTDAVTRSYHSYDSAKVRDFVEVLTERDAAEALRHTA